MDLTQGSQKERNARAKKMMLWFGIVSLIMTFAGWTSAYIVSSSREDWSSDMTLPKAFLFSTMVIIVSSLSYILAKAAMKKGNAAMTTLWLGVTLVLGIVFIVLQFQGFSELIAAGYYFTGPTSSVKSSYVFLIAAVHILHVVVGIISLLVVLYQQIRGRYTPADHLGLSLGAYFWHFLDLLWVYLVLFMFWVG